MVGDLEARAEQAHTLADLALSGLRDSILSLLSARGIPCPDATRTRVMACEEPATLQHWLLPATTAATCDEVFAE